MRRNPRTPPTPAVVDARRFAARNRSLLAIVGLALLTFWPDLTPAPIAAAIGFVIIGATGILHGRDISEEHLRSEEALSCTAGVLIVTLGNGTVTALTLIWLASAGIGVLARGGRAGSLGRILVLLILASPLVMHGVNADTIGFLFAGVALLLAVGRISLETAELLADPLTGVLSRAAFNAEVERRMARATPGTAIALIMIDLDDFGLVNKTEGYQAGDLRLTGAVTVMSESVRSTDLIGRLGGDEFAVMSAGTEAEGLAGRLIDAMAAAGFAASAGVSSAPDDGTDGPSLIAAADSALRYSKRHGKGRMTRFDAIPAMPPAIPDPGEIAVVVPT